MTKKSQKSIILINEKSAKTENSTVIAKQIEANARRKVARKWENVSQLMAYKRASAKESYRRTTAALEDELFDGVMLNLKEENNNISINAKKRLLRRIVEKKQAQSVHQQIGRTTNGFSGYLERKYTNKSMKDILGAIGFVHDCLHISRNSELLLQKFTN